MIPRIERTIQNLLTQGCSPKEVSSRLLTLWKQEPLNFEEKVCIANFWLNAQQYSYLLRAVVFSFAKKEFIPWAQLIDTLDATKSPMNNELIQVILQIALSQELVDQLAQSHSLDKKTAILKNLRHDRDMRTYESFERKKRKVTQKINLLRSEGLIEQEEAALREYQNYWPTDPALKEMWGNFQDRWAIQVFDRRTKKWSDWSRQALQDSLSSDEQKLTDFIFSEAYKLGRAKPKYAKDLSLMFYFIDAYKPALKMIQLAPPTSDVEWYQLELLLETRQFLQAIELSQKLEAKYASNPDSSFAATYARAQALRGMNQTHLAIELLNSILSIRPNYRAAHSLIADWEGGV